MYGPALSNAGAQRNLITICGGTPWGGMPMSELQLATALAKTRAVLYVDPPTSFSSQLRHGNWASLGTHTMTPMLSRFRFLVPPGSLRHPFQSVAIAISRRRIRRQVAQSGRHPSARIIAGDLPLFDPRTAELRVVYATDDLVAGASLLGLPEKRLRLNRKLQAQMCDIVIAASPAIANIWRSLGCDVIVVPNGCDYESFSTTDNTPPAADVSLPRPIAGFVGHLNNRLDFDLLEAVADRRFSLLLIGPTTLRPGHARFAALVSRPNVQWVGRTQFERMPSYLATFRVGLTPYARTQFNEASSPLKTLEYLAAGRPVVSSDLAASRDLKSPHIVIAQTPNAFADAVAAHLARPLLPSEVQERRLFAKSHSWNARAAEFANVLESAPRRPRSRSVAAPTD